MSDFNQFLNEREISPLKLKIGQRILSDDRNHDPLEVTGKPEKEIGGHWVPVKNLRTNKADRVWVDTGEQVKLDESSDDEAVDFDFELNEDGSLTMSFGDDEYTISEDDVDALHDALMGDDH